MNPVESFDADGLRVLVRPNRAHEAIAARFYVRGGAANLSAGTAGAEALYARVARRGTARYPKETLNATLAGVGAELGAVVSHDATVFTLRCLRRHFATAWDAYSDVILSPLLQSEDVQIVREQMLLERRQVLDSPDGALVERARQQVYAGHPYDANPAGNDASLVSLDSERIRGHMQQVCTRSNALLVFAGQVSAEEARRAAAVFADLPLGTGPTPLPPPLHFTASSAVFESRPLPTCYVLGQFAAPALRDPDHAAAWIAMSVLRDRFFEEVRTKRNLSYAPSASLGSDAANLGSIYVTAVDVPRTLEVMRAEIRRLATEAMPSDELEHKVRTFVTRYAMQNEGSQAQAAFLAAYELWGGGHARAEGMMARLEAVTREQVASAVQRVRHVQYTVLGDPAPPGGSSAATAPASVFVDP